MPICPNCEKQVDATLFCPECGAALIPEGKSDETMVMSSDQIRATHQRQWQSAEVGENRVIYGLMSGQRMPIQLHENEMVILGRGDKEVDGPDIDLTPYGAHKMGVSRQHVSVGVSGDLVEVQDLGSTNGSFLNGRQMTPNQLYILRNLDELRLGSFVMTISFM